MPRKKPKMYLVTPPGHWSKEYHVHNQRCRHFKESHHTAVPLDEVPAQAVDCKVCGGRGD